MNRATGYIFLALALIGAGFALKRILPAVIRRDDTKGRTESIVETTSGLPGTRDANFSSASDFQRNHNRTYERLDGPATPYNYGMI